MLHIIYYFLLSIFFFFHYIIQATQRFPQSPRFPSVIMIDSLPFISSSICRLLINFVCPFLSWSPNDLFSSRIHFSANQVVRSCILHICFTRLIRRLCIVASMFAHQIIFPSSKLVCCSHKPVIRSFLGSNIINSNTAIFYTTALVIIHVSKTYNANDNNLIQYTPQFFFK